MTAGGTFWQDPGAEVILMQNPYIKKSFGIF